MFNKNNAISFSFDPGEKYTIWTGLLGGFFLSLYYFGTDQSQVSRYINAKDKKERRIGLMFNAILKIPFQFFILYVGFGVLEASQKLPRPSGVKTHCISPNGDKRSQMDLVRTNGHDFCPKLGYKS